MNEALAAELQAFVVEHCGIPSSKVRDDTLLFSSGLLDSFSLVGIVTFFEQKTGLKVKPREIEFANFDSVSRMVSFAARRAA